jgi:hypothetical protein
VFHLMDGHEVALLLYGGGHQDSPWNRSRMRRYSMYSSVVMVCSLLVEDSNDMDGHVDCKRGLRIHAETS